MPSGNGESKILGGGSVSLGWGWEGAGVGGHSPRGTPGIFFEKFIKILHFNEKICSPLTLDRNNNKINVRSYHGLLGVKDIALHIRRYSGKSQIQCNRNYTKCEMLAIPRHWLPELSDFVSWFNGFKVQTDMLNFLLFTGAAGCPHNSEGTRRCTVIAAFILCHFIYMHTTLNVGTICQCKVSSRPIPVRYRLSPLTPQQLTRNVTTV